MARPSQRLPTDPVTRVAVISSRSRPDPDRPRLSEELEKRLEPVERKSAECYAQAEELTHQIRKARESLTGEKLPAVANGRRG